MAVASALRTARGRLDARRAARIIDAERRRAPAALRPLATLTPHSLALTALDLSAPAPRVNLLLPAVTPSRMFAGARTALAVAEGLAARLGLPVRVLDLSTTGGELAAAGLARLAALMPRVPDVSSAARADLGEARFHPDDVWIATHWVTAHALQVAVDAGLLPRGRAVSLVQDYEPGFTAWATEYAVARSVYHAGFLTLVNSSPLASYLRTHETLDVDADLVFAPSFDEPLLRHVAESRAVHEATTVLFYARPSKPRNLYDLGITALALASERLPAGSPVEFRAAGEPAPDHVLGTRRLRSMGALAWDDYFGLLTRSDVVVSLQYSPHPSHPPLEAAISGARAVTNEFDGSRADLHRRLAAVPAEAHALADAIVEAVGLARRAPDHGYEPVAPGALGHALPEVLDRAASRL